MRSRQQTNSQIQDHSRHALISFNKTRAQQRNRRMVYRLRCNRQLYRNITSNIIRRRRCWGNLGIWCSILEVICAAAPTFQTWPSHLIWHRSQYQIRLFRQHQVRLETQMDQVQISIRISIRIRRVRTGLVWVRVPCWLVEASEQETQTIWGSRNKRAHTMLTSHWDRTGFCISLRAADSTGTQGIICLSSQWRVKAVQLHSSKALSNFSPKMPTVNSSTDQ